MIAERLPVREWPARRLLVTAVDAVSGEFVVFDRDSGVSLVDAVGASCAVPGVWPPVTIGGRRYVDGGVRSAVNADLAAGAEAVVVLAPTRGVRADAAAVGAGGGVARACAGGGGVAGPAARRRSAAMCWIRRGGRRRRGPGGRRRRRWPTRWRRCGADRLRSARRVDQRRCAVGVGVGTGRGFRAAGRDGYARRLSELLAAGPVVLFFYPAAMTRGCTAESCHFRDLAAEFAAVGAPGGHQPGPGGEAGGVLRRHGFDYPLLSDVDGAVAQAFGVRRRVPLGPLSTRRMTFVIGTDRRVVEVIHSEVSMNEHADRALRALGGDLRGVAAGWYQGSNQTVYGRGM